MGHEPDRETDAYLIPQAPVGPTASAVLNRAQCAHWLGISTRQLARLNVPCVRLGRAVRYPVPLVLRWLERKAVSL